MTSINGNSTPDLTPDQDVPLKRCRKCGRELPATKEFFSPNKGGKFGCLPDCRQCRRKLSPEQYEIWKAKRRSAKTPETGVYVLHYEEIPGFYKIGMCWDLRTRIRAYITSVPFEPVVDLFIPYSRPEKLETALHNYFKPVHHKREWYKLEPSDFELLEEIAKEEIPTDWAALRISGPRAITPDNEVRS